MTPHVDPTLESKEGLAIKAAAEDLKYLENVDADMLVQWIVGRPEGVGVLGLIVGLSQEKLKNSLRHGLGTAAFRKLAVERPAELIAYMDQKFALLQLLEAQRQRTYDFGDVLVARAGSRAFAVRAGESGRRLEDEIEEVAKRLSLPYQLRCRFEGRNARTAPCDLAIPGGHAEAQIVVASKSFDSTGSKLSDAVREIEEMADVRRPRQFVLAVVDGIGWKGRPSDLRRIYDLWDTGQIDGMYTLATLGEFQEDLAEAAALRGLSAPG